MLEFFQNHQVLWIIIVLSPFFIGVFLLAAALSKGRQKAKKYPIYWLILTIIFSLMSIYFFYLKRDVSEIMLIGSWAAAAYSTFLRKKQ
jgi:FtsH-binding integral membrane protein